MTYQNFKSLIGLMIKQSKRINKLYDLGLDIHEVLDEHDRIVDGLWKEVLTTEGYDWLSWYLYDKNGITGKPKDNLEAKDENGDNICYNLLSTYNYLKKSGYIKSINK